MVLLGAYSCKKVTLDGLAFPAVKLDNYKFKDYEDPELDIPQNMMDAPIQQTLIPFTSTDAESGEEYTIYGLYMGDTSTISTDTIIYFCHGQARHNDYYWTRQALIAQIGGLHNYGVFMIDYRGYGMSDGTSTEKGLIEDTDAGLNWLIDHGATEEKTLFYGFSLGCIPLINLAANRTDFQAIGLICESPLGSVEYLAQSSMQLNVDADFVSTLEFNNAEQIKNVQIPYMWIHGVEDDYVSIDNGELIYSNYNGSYKEAYRVENANHADIPTVMGFDLFMNTIQVFLQK